MSRILFPFFANFFLGVVWLTVVLLPQHGLTQEVDSYHPLGEWGTITSEFGYRNNPFSNRRDLQFHKGIDIDCEIGDSVYAWRAGRVVFTGKNKYSGNIINLAHADGYISKYHHLEKILVDENDLVEAGELIALAGATGRVTGSHLHFTIMENDEHIDPLPYLQETQLAGMPGNPPKTYSIIYKQLHIRSQPTRGNVYVDGEYMGITPLTVRLTYGEHFIEVDSDGDNYTERVWVDEDFSTLYNARLQIDETDPEEQVDPLPVNMPTLQTGDFGVFANLAIPFSRTTQFSNHIWASVAADLGIFIPIKIDAPSFLKSGITIGTRLQHGEFDDDRNIEVLNLEDETIAATGEVLNDYQIFAGNGKYNLILGLSSRVAVRTHIGVTAGQLRIRAIERVEFVDTDGIVQTEGSGTSTTHRRLYIAPEIGGGVIIALDAHSSLCVDVYRSYFATDVDWFGVRVGVSRGF